MTPEKEVLDKLRRLSAEFDVNSTVRQGIDLSIAVTQDFIKQLDAEEAYSMQRLRSRAPREGMVSPDGTSNGQLSFDWGSSRPGGIPERCPICGSERGPSGPDTPEGVPI